MGPAGVLPRVELLSSSSRSRTCGASSHYGRILMAGAAILHQIIEITLVVIWLFQCCACFLCNLFPHASQFSIWSLFAVPWKTHLCPCEESEAHISPMAESSKV